jgi:hypothetical protein
MTADEYLRGVLAREHIDTGPQSPVRQMRDAFLPLLEEWAGNLLLSVEPSGSFAKGTAVISGTDIDLFISLSPSTIATLKDIHDSLTKRLQEVNSVPRPQTVSIGVRVGNYAVDLVPAKRRDHVSDDHSLYHRKSGTPRKTNITRHIREVTRSGRLDEIKLLKIWRNQKRLDFPSFYLELTTINALAGRPHGSTLGSNLWHVFIYLRDSFPDARVPDPAVPSNAVSDDLTMAERLSIKRAAIDALRRSSWAQIIA